MATSLRYEKGRAFFDNNGALLASGTLTYYRATTTTLLNVYSDAGGLTALPNPVTLNSAGRAVDGSSTAVAIYLKDLGFDYKEVIANSAGTALYTDDNIAEPVDPTAGVSDFAKPLTEVSTDTSASVTLVAADFGKLRLANTTSNSITYALPSAATVGNGKPIGIKKTSSANTVTLDADGADTIDGTATFAWTSDDRTIWLVSDGANWQVSSEYGSATVGVQSFTASGTYTPTARMKHCIVFSTGAGGGGGGADSAANGAESGGGGGAGGTCIEAFTAAQIGASQTVTIGAGGTAGADTGGNGGSGGDTTFGALHTAGGGGGGIGVTTAGTGIGNGGAAGTATGGLINIPGGGGNSGQSDNTNNVAFGGQGGSSFWGGSGVPPVRIGSGVNAGVNGSAYGSGATGAIAVDDTTGAAGGVGAAGVCVVIEFI